MNGENLFPAEILIKARRVVEKSTQGEDRAMLLAALDLDWDGGQPPQQRLLGELPQASLNGDGFYSDQASPRRDTWGS